MRKNLAVFAAVMALAAPTLSAQDATSDTVLRALLDEIRTLRLALQKNSAFEIRGRLLVERARMHQENIRELAREVENATDFMRPTETDPTWESEAAMMEANMETRFASITDPEERRKAIERQKQAMEQRKAMEARHREQMRQRYQRMEIRLAEERDKLRAIEEELEKIQSELTK